MKEYDPSTAFDEGATVEPRTVDEALRQADAKMREATKAFKRLNNTLSHSEAIQLHCKRGTGKRWGGKRRKRKTQ